MILQALTRYYDILNSDPNILLPPFGYSVERVRYAIVISPQGEIVSIVPLFREEKRGKKIFEISQPMILPENVDRSSDITSNFLYDTSAYVLGISINDKKKPGYSSKRFDAFREQNSQLLRSAKCPASYSLLAFFDRYDINSLRAHPVIQEKFADLIKSGNFVFKVTEETGFIHQDLELRRVWDEQYCENSSLYVGQCLVTGVNQPIAKLHKKIKGLGDGTPIPLVSYDKDSTAFASYNKFQGYNAPVSEVAVFKYKTALNYLLSGENPSPEINIGNTRVVYWAESPDRVYTQLFTELWEQLPQDLQINEPISVHDNPDQVLLDNIAEKIQQVKNLDINSIVKDLDADIPFYILGLEASKGRIAIRFFEMDPFIKIAQRLVDHYKTLVIVNERGYPGRPIPVWKILDETVPHAIVEKRYDKISPRLPSELLRSIFQGGTYPLSLYQAIINRIRSEVDKPATDQEPAFNHINYVRVAVIKSTLVRKYRNQPDSPVQEVLCMALNEQSAHPAYLLGRLFAVLENAQTDAIGDVNATIKDRYFTTACASPATVFPVLLRLAQHHIAKGEHGRSNDWRIEQILGMLKMDQNPIPKHLSLDEQGVFILGYYHQRAAFFQSRTAKENADQNSIDSVSNSK